jgi:hypothetical protein
MTDIKGVTYPIPKKFMDRFMVEGKTVFIRPASCFKNIKPGMKLVFYQSRENTGFIGEGEILEIAFSEDPFTFFEQFPEKVFLNHQELVEYLENQKQWKTIRVRKSPPKKKLWMAIELKNIVQYPQIQKPSRFVPVGGQYLRG